MKHKLIASIILCTLLIAPSANYAMVTPTYQQGVVLNDSLKGVFETFPEGSFLVYGQDMMPVRKNKDGSLSKLTITKGVSIGLRFVTDNNKSCSLIQGVLYDAQKKVLLKGIKNYNLTDDLYLYDRNNNTSILCKSNGKLIQLKSIGISGSNYTYTLKTTTAGTYYVFTENNLNLSQKTMNAYIYKLGTKAAKKVELLNAPIRDIQFTSLSGQGQGTLLLHQKNQLTLYADQLETYTYKVKAHTYDWGMNESQLIIDEAGKVAIVDLNTHQVSMLTGDYASCPAPFYKGITGVSLANNKAWILDAQENIKTTFDYENATNFPSLATTVAAVADQKTNETGYLWYGQMSQEQYEEPLKTHLSYLLPSGAIQSINLSHYLVYSLGTQPSITDFEKVEAGSLYFKNDAKFPAFKVDSSGAFSYVATQDSAETLLLKKIETIPVSEVFSETDENLVNLYSGKQIPLKTYPNSKITYQMTDNFLFLYTDWNNESSQDTLTAYDKLGNFVFTVDTFDAPYDATELTAHHIYFVENKTPYLYDVTTKSLTKLDHLIFSTMKNYHYTPKISNQPRKNLDQFYYVVGPDGNQISNLSGKLLDTSADFYNMIDDTHFTYSKNNLWGLITIDEKGTVTQMPADYQKIVYQPEINAYIAKNPLGLSEVLTLEGNPLISGAYDQIDLYDNCIVAKSGSKTLLFQLTK